MPKFTEMYESIVVPGQGLVTEGLIVEESSFASGADYVVYTGLLTLLGGAGGANVKAVMETVWGMRDEAAAVRINTILQGAVDNRTPVKAAAIAAIREIIRLMPDKTVAGKIEERLKKIEAKEVEGGISYMNTRSPKQI